MTHAIQGTNTEKLYQELGLKALQSKRKLRSLCLFYKIYKDHTLPYIHKLIPICFESFYSLRATKEIPLFTLKHDFFKNYFFPLMIIEWNIL